MKRLDIAVTKAQLVSYTVNANEDGPQVSATISLMTEGGKQLTTYTISTNSWNDKDKFDLPLRAVAPIAEIARILEDIVVKHCRDAQLALGPGRPADDHDEPINLDDIPF